MTGEDDATLLARIARKDRRAMRALYERHFSSLYGFLRARGADASLADDVLQDAMLDVWRQAGRFRGSSSVRTWLFAIARNKMIDRMRSAGRMTLVAEVPDTPDEGPDAEATVAAAQDAQRLRLCVDALPPQQRSAVRLAFFEDLTYDEIGQIEDIPPGTVKSRIFHAKQSLMRCLGRS